MSAYHVYKAVVTSHKTNLIACFQVLPYWLVEIVRGEWCDEKLGKEKIWCTQTIMWELRAYHISRKLQNQAWKNHVFSGPSSMCYDFKDLMFNNALISCFKGYGIPAKNSNMAASVGVKSRSSLREVRVKCTILPWCTLVDHCTSYIDTCLWSPLSVMNTSFENAHDLEDGDMTFSEKISIFQHNITLNWEWCIIWSIHSSVHVYVCCCTFLKPDIPWGMKLLELVWLSHMGMISVNYKRHLIVLLVVLLVTIHIINLADSSLLHQWRTNQ